MSTQADVKAGVAEFVRMKITGYATGKMFDRYKTVDKIDAEKAVMKMEVFLSKC